MQTFLERFEKLLESKDYEKMKIFLAEIGAFIEAFAETTDHYKKQNYIWNKKTSELCILRNMIQEEIKNGS